MTDPRGRSEPRSRAFGDAAQEYDRVRLSPPPEAVRWLVSPGSTLVLDLAAGTGQLCRRLEGMDVGFVAVEPDERMRAVLLERSPGARVLAGLAENIPLRDQSVDAVVVGSAWHWFNPGRALAEVARVIRDGGSLGVIGTSPDPFVAWVNELFGTEADPHRRKVRETYADVSLPPEAPFGPVSTASFSSSVTMPVDQVLALFATHSNYLVATDEEKAELDRHATEVLSGHTGDAGAVELPVQSWGWRTERARRPGRP
ncbi:class I SAM-dependent methyltransferase [Amycolatopsis sp. H20-H5]|uniref:class I SAM-dependent methyltransferase n=1 Tax=Amycolatopsis sp. H20-H5 TaxID=3046309 RepID=UPI002DB82BC2|nr:class I SAM-dependent methyltransferase [Amycolatopsis sp. H20-H5]MEC3979502.1 class I SAM-dependent methyltransferase [Amycolatopsis sp. H20-H5]